MKWTILLLSILILVFSECKRGIEKQNHFSSDLDTLIIKTEKIKGPSLIPSGYYGLTFSDTSDTKYFNLIYPNDISNIQIGYEIVDLKLWCNQNFYGNSDSIYVPSRAENSISFMKGVRADKKVVIVDQNNNKDFRDDTIRLERKFDYKCDSNFIFCNYHIFNGIKTTKDSGWINLGSDQYYGFAFSVAHHLESKFSIGNDTYSFEMINYLPYLRFCFENPILAIVEQDGVKKDSLLKSEMYEIGEYLKLGKNYYRFDNVLNDGSFLTFVKEKDVSSKIGTQPGFIAPNFTCKSIDGDSINLTDYKGKYLLIANTTSCWSEIMSYEYYKELSQKYASKLNIIGIDNSPIILQQNIKNLNLAGPFIIAENNSSIQSNYREDYCSRTCFLINPEGRIIDRFEIRDWKSSLEKYFD